MTRTVLLWLPKVAYIFFHIYICIYIYICVCIYIYRAAKVSLQDVLQMTKVAPHEELKDGLAAEIVSLMAARS